MLLTTTMFLSIISHSRTVSALWWCHMINASLFHGHSIICSKAYPGWQQRNLRSSAWQTFLCWNRLWIPSKKRQKYRKCMMTSSNGNIFRVTGPLCGEFSGSGEFPTPKAVTRSFGVLFDLRLYIRLNKQPWGWWFETPSWSLWRHRNGNVVMVYGMHTDFLEYRLTLLFPYSRPPSTHVYRPALVISVHQTTPAWINDNSAVECGKNLLIHYRWGNNNIESDWWNRMK